MAPRDTVVLLTQSCKVKWNNGSQILFDLLPVWLQERWKGQTFTQMCWIFVGRETWAVGSNLEKHSSRLAEVDRVEVEPIDDGRHRADLPGDLLSPLQLFLIVGSAKCDVMHASNTWTTKRYVRAHIQVNLGSGPSCPHFKDVDRAVLFGLIGPALAEAERPGEQSGCWVKRSCSESHRVQAVNRHRSRNRTSFTGEALQSSPIIDQFQALPFGVTKRYHRFFIISTQLNAFMGHFEALEALHPPLQSFTTIYA